MSGAYLYILPCADGSFYTGTARKGLELRVAEHNAGTGSEFTATRRPVALVFAEYFESMADAIAMERRIKGWSRAKKEALIAGNWKRLQSLSQRRRPHPSRRAPRKSALADLRANIAISGKPEIAGALLRMRIKGCKAVATNGSGHR